MKEESVKKFITDRNGLFIKTYYKNTISKGKSHSRFYVEYTCDKGHPNNKRTDTLSKAWCYECTKNTIDDVQNLAKRIGWKLLDKVYINCKTKHRWECDKGHVIEMNYNNALRGKGCKKCLMRSLEDLQKVAQDKGGQCLSTEYTTVRDKYKFRCGNGHEWETTGAIIMSGSWCAQCNVGISERTCHKITEYLYKVPFSKKRPDWLISDIGGRLELDAYNEDLKLAIEYNGKQHYEHVAYFHSLGGALERRKSLDQLKEKLCQGNGVHLIVVPYTVPYHDLYKYIKERCPNLPEDIPESIDYKDLGLTGVTSEMRDMVQRILDEKYTGGKIVGEYLNNYTPIKFICKRGHELEQTWAILNSGTFCVECTLQDVRDKMIPIINKYCVDNNLQLFTTYTNAKGKLNWRCNRCNIDFTRTWDGISRMSHKCKDIIKQSRALNQMGNTIKSYCQTHNIELFDIYKDCKTPMAWKCDNCQETFNKSWINIKKSPHKCTT